MMWGIPKMSRRFLAPVAGLVALLLLGFWVFKIRGIQRLRSEILQVEGKLSKGQEMWRNSPPLSPGEREELQKAQERLWRALPREKDVPPVLQDISRVAQDYNLSNLSLTTKETAAASSPRDWNDPANYHLVLNTEALGLDGAAGVIVGLIPRSGS